MTPTLGETVRIHFAGKIIEGVVIDTRGSRTVILDSGYTITYHEHVIEISEDL